MKNFLRKYWIKLEKICNLKKKKEKRKKPRAFIRSFGCSLSLWDDDQPQRQQYKITKLKEVEISSANRAANPTTHSPLAFIKVKESKIKSQSKKKWRENQILVCLVKHRIWQKEIPGHPLNYLALPFSVLGFGQGRGRWDIKAENKRRKTQVKRGAHDTVR